MLVDADANEQEKNIGKNNGAEGKRINIDQTKSEKRRVNNSALCMIDKNDNGFHNCVCSLFNRFVAAADNTIEGVLC